MYSICLKPMKLSILYFHRLSSGKYLSNHPEKKIIIKNSSITQIIFVVGAL